MSFINYIDQYGFHSSTEPHHHLNILVTGDGGYFLCKLYPYSKVPGANMGPIFGRQDPDGPHVDPMNFAIWVTLLVQKCDLELLNRSHMWQTAP